MQYTATARNVNLRMTVPDGLTKIKGVFAFTTRGLASGWASSTHFKDLARRLDSVIVTVGGGDDLNDNSYPNRCASGEFNGLGEALEKLGMASNHPELANAPVVGAGHSHGGDWWNWYNACHPERMVAVLVHASGGVNYSEAALKTPVFYTLNTGDLIENGSGKPRAGMWANRAKGAPMTLVIAAGGHNTQFPPEEYQIVTAILEAIFKMRVPADADGAKGPIKLFDIVEGENTWVGDLYSKEISTYAAFKGTNKALTSFLPNEMLAMMWKTNGPALPASVMLPTSGPCTWCGTPKDEPKATGTNPGPPAAAADGGATPPPAADASATTPTVSPDAGVSLPTKKDAAPVVTPPPADPQPEETPPAKHPSGGCSVAAGSSAGAPLLLLLAIYGLRRRRR